MQTGGISPIGRIRLAALSVAGAVCGHTLAYAISYPDRLSRQSVLQVTGHAYWHAALAAAVVAAVWFAAGHARAHFRAGRAGYALVDRGRPTFATLAALQAGVFIGMEVSERIAAGAPLGTVLDRRLLLLGLAVQVAVAAALTLASIALGSAARTAGRGVASLTMPQPVARSWPIPSQQWPLARAVVPYGSRGPPAS